LTVIDAVTMLPLGAPLVVQFNPASLSISYSTSATGGGRVAGGPGGNEANRLQVTSTDSRLGPVELLFDTTQTGEDVRVTTLRIVDEMITPPNASPDSNEAAPWVRFQWGTFFFLGRVSSVDETLDLFSTEGKPLRSTVRLSMTEVLPLKPEPGGAGISLSASAAIGVSPGAGRSPGGAVGTTPLTLAQAGDTLQRLAARAGAGVSWKSVAAANNVDNPRLLPPGAVLDLNARANASIG
jgi:hypothetical protein